MYVDEDTFSALSVFVSEGHPVSAGKGKTREGLSLFGLMDRTKSKQGSRVLRRWISSPTQSLNKIMQREDSIEFFTAPANSSFVGQLRPHFRDLCNFSVCVPVFQRYCQTDREWGLLRRGLNAVAQVRPVLEALTFHEHPSVRVSQPDCLTQFKDAVLGEPVRAVESLLNGVLDFDDNGKTSIKTGIDDNVDRLREIYEHLPVILDELAKVDRKAYAETVGPEREIHAIYSPQIGFLTAVPLNEENTDETQADDDADSVIGKMSNLFSTDYRFRTFNAAYFKTKNCRRCDNKFGDVYTALIDAENEVLHKVAQRIDAVASVLLTIAENAAEIDAATALALVAVDNGWSRPQFDLSGSRLELFAMKHPLLEGLSSSAVVPNDVVFDEHDGSSLKRCVFLTGPNGSGKSVFMSAIACIVLLAQCGSFVPAERAILPQFDSVQCHGHIPDSVQNSMSSFMTECSQVSKALAKSTCKTLLLLDEFGKGTDPENGLSLVAATLDYLAKLPLHTRPWTFFVTHFNNALDLLPENSKAGISPLTMQCLEEEEEEENTEKRKSKPVVFLFRVIPGVSSDSLSFQCARSAGLPQSLIERALLVANALKDNTPSFASVRLLPSVMNPEEQAKQSNLFEKLLELFDKFDPESDDIHQFIASCQRITKNEE